MRSMQPVFSSVGQGKRVKISSTHMPLLVDPGEQEKIHPFNIDNQVVYDLTSFTHATTESAWDKDIALRKVLVCDKDDNEYYMIVLGSGLLKV